MTLNIHRNAVIVLIFCGAYPIVTIIVPALAKNLAKHSRIDDPRARSGVTLSFRRGYRDDLDARDFGVLPGRAIGAAQKFVCFGIANNLSFTVVPRERAANLH